MPRVFEICRRHCDTRAPPGARSLPLPSRVTIRHSPRPSAISQRVRPCRACDAIRMHDARRRPCRRIGRHPESAESRSTARHADAYPPSGTRLIAMRTPSRDSLLEVRLLSRGPPRSRPVWPPGWRGNRAIERLFPQVVRFVARRPPEYLATIDGGDGRRARSFAPLASRARAYDPRSIRPRA